MCTVYGALHIRTATAIRYIRKKYLLVIFGISIRRYTAITKMIFNLFNIYEPNGCE